MKFKFFPPVLLVLAIFVGGLTLNPNEARAGECVLGVSVDDSINAVVISWSVVEAQVGNAEVYIDVDGEEVVRESPDEEGYIILYGLEPGEHTAVLTQGQFPIIEGSFPFTDYVISTAYGNPAYPPHPSGWTSSFTMVDYNTSDSGTSDCSGAVVTFTVGEGTPPEPPAQPCSVISFSADNSNPAYDSNTTLRFNFNDNYNWTITLDQGSVQPFLNSGFGISSQSDTGNLTSPHTYHLRCNGQTDPAANAWVTVTPGAPSGGSFVDNSTTVFTTAIPSTVNAGQVVPFTVRVQNTGDTRWYHGDAYRFLQASNLSIAPTYGHLPFVASVNDNIDWSFNLTAPTIAGTYSLNMRMNHMAGWNYMRDSDGVQSAGPASNTPFGGTAYALFDVVAPSGTLSATNCTVLSGQSTCNSTLNWTTANLTANPTAVTRNNPTVTVSTATSGTNVSNAVSPGSCGPSSSSCVFTYFLYHNSVELSQSSMTAECTSGTTWNGSSCAPTPINGACSPDHYLCVTGTSTNNVNGSTEWTWDCDGINGGTDASCSEPKGTTCTNGATNPPACTTTDGGSTCINGATNPPLCTIDGGGVCINGATNPPTCTTDSGGGCVNGATNPPVCNNLPREPVYIED